MKITKKLIVFIVTVSLLVIQTQAMNQPNNENSLAQAIKRAFSATIKSRLLPFAIIPINSSLGIYDSNTIRQMDDGNWQIINAAGNVIATLNSSQITPYIGDVFKKFCANLQNCTDEILRTNNGNLRDCSDRENGFSLAFQILRLYFSCWGISKFINSLDNDIKAFLNNQRMQQFASAHPYITGGMSTVTTALTALSWFILMDITNARIELNIGELLFLLVPIALFASQACSNIDSALDFGCGSSMSLSLAVVILYSMVA